MTGAVACAGLALRPIEDADLPFLYRVYASTRYEELSVTGWAPAQVEAFLQMQFRAQHTHYQRSYDDAVFHVVLLDGQPVGRLYVTRTDDAVHVIDVAVLPEFRGRGIGTTLLEELIAEAEAGGKATSIYVERNNPALSLYTRLGFELREDEEPGVYLRMIRPPSSS